MAEPMLLNVGDTVQMRKPHPCGGDTWRIVRVGADIGIRCLTCNRKVMLPRAECERRIKRMVARAVATEDDHPVAAASPSTRVDHA